MILTTMSLWMCASVHNSSAAMTHLLVRVLLLNHCDRMTGNVPATICRTRQQKDLWAVQQPQRREEGDESVSLNAEPTVLAGCLCSVFSLRHQMCLHTCMCSVYTLDHPWNLHDKSTRLASSRPVSIMLSHFIHSRLHSILGPALALLRFAPVETAKGSAHHRRGHGQHGRRGPAPDHEHPQRCHRGERAADSPQDTHRKGGQGRLPPEDQSQPDLAPMWGVHAAPVNWQL